MMDFCANVDAAVEEAVRNDRRSALSNTEIPPEAGRTEPVNANETEERRNDK
jgi:hypothetical protein